MPPRLNLLVLNAGAQRGAFEEIRAFDASGVDVVYADYRVSWEEISARRRGERPPDVEPPAAGLGAALRRADVVFGFHVPRGLAELAPRLQWLETPSTGIDHLRGTGIIESKVEVTTVGGLFAPLLAEHVFAGMLYFAKRMAHFEEQRRRRAWRMDRIGALQGRTVGLLGVGNIGRAVAVRAKAFGMNVIGLGRHVGLGRVVEGVDRLLERDGLDELLGSSDYVVVAVADTAETRRMIGAPQLATMRSDAVLINVARGAIVDEPALVEALRDGRIAGAALDVFADEPLPAESPLWTLPNALVTPHVAVNVADYLEQAIRHFIDNFRRFVAGEPLADRFDRQRGY